jgi:hypothetical protein
MTEAEALKRFIPILGRISTPHERQVITRNILERIAGQQTSVMGINHSQAGALAWPADPAKAKAFENALNVAVDGGEFLSLLHRHDRRHFQIEELASWPDCPAIAPDSPLTFWLGEPAPVQDTATPAPVVAESANNGPLPLTTGDIAFCFDGIRWNEQQWRKPLGDKPKWLQSCVAIPGQRGVSETRWNPVLIAAALVHDGHAQARSIRAKFQTKPLLKDWLEAWKTYEADNFGTQ